MACGLEMERRRRVAALRQQAALIRAKRGCGEYDLLRAVNCEVRADLLEHCNRHFPDVVPSHADGVRLQPGVLDAAYRGPMTSPAQLCAEDESIDRMRVNRTAGSPEGLRGTDRSAPENGGIAR